MNERQRELAEIMRHAIHKLSIEIARKTASPRVEYEVAIEHLDEFKREFLA